MLLRKIERWLHQHIFKVGWLVTRNYRTTTILYYAIFFPGVVLHEVTYWLMAGALNVFAEHSIQWPEAQEIGELKLNFVRISPKAGVYRRAIISIAPLVVALTIIWIVANNVFDLSKVLQTMSTGDLDDVSAGLSLLTSAPDFWLWVYLIFTISNTMYPQIPKDLQGWRTILSGIGLISVVLILIGVGHDAFQMVSVPMEQFLSVFQGILVFVICINILMTMILGAIESAIERITGYSATFKRGKMITMTRDEAIAQRQKDRERQRKQQTALSAAPKRNVAADTGIGSVYLLMLPIPGGPEEEALAPVYKIEAEPIAALPDKPTVSPRLGAEVITLGDAPPAPSKAPALPEGTSTKPKRLPKAAPVPKPTLPPEAPDKVASGEVSEAVNLLRNPKSTEAPSVSVSPSQVEEAVSTFRTTAPDKAKPAQEAEKSSQADQGAHEQLPAASVSPASPTVETPKPSMPFNRPASPFGPKTTVTGDLTAAAKPTSTPAPFSRPASPFGPKTDTSDLPAAAKPTSTPEPFVRPASPFGPKTDTGNLPAVAKPTSTPAPFNRPVSPFGPKTDTSNLPAASKPANKSSEDYLDSLPTPTVKHYAPFERPPSPLTSTDDEDEEDLSSFRSKPSIRPGSSTMFNRPTSPLGPKTDVGDQPAAKPSTPFSRPASPFGPRTTDTSDLPAASKPTSTPAPFNQPASPFGPRTEADKPDSGRPAFTPPSRFGSKPAAPFGNPPSKPTSPFSTDDDESILGRSGTGARDATDDLFEDMGRSNPAPPLKRTTNIQPIIKAGGFGTSRPVPKKPLSRQEEDEDEMGDLRDDLRYEDEDPRYSDDDEEASSSGDDD